MTSHFEILGAKGLIHRPDKLHQQPSTTDNKCRLCNKEVEDVTHILLRNCSKMSPRYYLPLRHDVIAKYVYKKFRKQNKL